MTLNELKQKTISTSNGIYKLKDQELLNAQKLLSSANETILSAEYDFNKSELFVRCIRYDSQDRIYSTKITEKELENLLGLNSKKVK